MNNFIAKNDEKSVKMSEKNSIKFSRPPTADGSITQDGLNIDDRDNFNDLLDSAGFYIYIFSGFSINLF